MITLYHPQGTVSIKELENGKRMVKVNSYKKMFIPNSYCETSYTLDLISLILETFGLAYLIDEIQRDEHPCYVQDRLEQSILAYISEEKLQNARLLDFGCGAGSSTMIIARKFSKTEIVGVDIRGDFVKIAQARSIFYNFENKVRFFVASNCKVPEKIGKFDFIVLNAVYEHLLPQERKKLMPQLWGSLKKGGIIFINETPYRYYPIETHTTGLPFINYLPDRMAHTIARRFSGMVELDESWEVLLRRGIRGATEHEILQTIRNCCGEPVLLTPSRLGFKDRIDLWYMPSHIGSRKTGTIVTFQLAYEIHKSNFLRFILKALLNVTGTAFVNLLTIAIQKAS